MSSLIEANPDGTISGDEEGGRAELIQAFEQNVNNAIDQAIYSAEKVGGQFRTPGIKRQLLQILLKAGDQLKGGPLTRGKVANTVGRALGNPPPRLSDLDPKDPDYVP